MVISDRARCIFVHIQKTGGASIAHLLTGGDRNIETQLLNGRRHPFARELRAVVGPAIWDAYFKFAFVRNPWDRLVSWYHMCVQAKTPNPFERYVQENAPTFGDFVTRTTTGIAEKTLANQLDYVTDDNGELLVDFVGRYERLREDYAEIAPRLGVSGTLPHANTSRHAPYREYFTDETRDIVGQRFARDIRYFGYEF